MIDRETVPTSLLGIANRAKTDPKHRFRNLYGELNEAYLLDCWSRIRKDAACGVDGVSAKDYEQNLGGNVRNLVGRLKRKMYRARLVRRRYIPKGKGKRRPLGIPAAAVRTLPEALDATPEVVVSAGEYRLVGSPVRVAGYQPDYRPPPALDEFGESQSS